MSCLVAGVGGRPLDAETLKACDEVWTNCALQRPSLRSLRGEQKCLNQFALSANGPREPLVPLALRNLGLAIQPFRKKLQLRSVNLPALHAIK
jgi:hypothetical protein